jgi:aminoglycoside/choline kinase family phosphotransferase
MPTAPSLRETSLRAWLEELPLLQSLKPLQLQPLGSDASVRQYARVWRRASNTSQPGPSWIAMDCPPDLLSVSPFMHVAQALERVNLLAPRVLAAHEAQGFLLLTDLGHETLLQVLQKERQPAMKPGAGAVAATSPEPVPSATSQTLMRSALQLLVDWQVRMVPEVLPKGLPQYDRAWLQRELELFPEWCVKAHFGIQWDDSQHKQWLTVCDKLLDSALEQPVVAVHRDFMPRNLMVTPQGLALLDFQDAAWGPISYDAISLSRDAFLSWQEEDELDWAVRYWQAARNSHLPVPDDFGLFWRQMEWMGVQRHLKILGIFCRLWHRDGKPGYVTDLPRFLGYIHRVATRYHGLGPLALLIEPLMGTQRMEAFY